MIRSLSAKFLLLLVSVVAVGLSGTFLLRELMVQDFRGYLEGEMLDRVSWVVASLESSRARAGLWRREDLVRGTVWAAMMGMDLKVYDERGALLMDTGEALESLPPLVKKRMRAVAAGGERAQREYVPAPLFLGGKQIGRLEAWVAAPRREALFVRRSNKFLLVSVVALGGVAVVLSIVFSRMLTRPIKELTAAASRISEGDLESRVHIPRSDELGTLSETFNAMAQNLLTQERLKRRLTADIAHELRTPLSAVRGELEGMIDGLIPTDRKTLESLHAEIGRLRSILEGIEDLSQAEASSLALRKEDLTLSHFLRNIVDRYQGVFEDKGIALSLEAPEETVVAADPDKLSQVVINLLSNALKATAPGGKVAVRASRRGKEALIEVSDTGRGIEEKDLPFIFERFYRPGHPGRGSLGIGLTIVKELVQAHGGRVEVTSRPGKGSVFSVFLPL
jgi:two-component system sensor histidine kinase BaeS